MFGLKTLWRQSSCVPSSASGARLSYSIGPKQDLPQKCRDKTLLKLLHSKHARVSLENYHSLIISVFATEILSKCLLEKSIN